MLVWVPVFDKDSNAINDFIPGTIKQITNDGMVVINYKKTKGPDTIQREKLQQRTEDEKIQKDLGDIQVLNEAEILKSLENNFKNDEIFCFCGPSLVVVNPYKIIQ